MPGEGHSCEARLGALAGTNNAKIRTLPSHQKMRFEIFQFIIIIVNW